MKSNKSLQMLGFVPQPNLRFCLTQAYWCIQARLTDNDNAQLRHDAHQLWRSQLGML
ncbi:hypothetical protein [Nostoc sp.]|uniref:hypothetical protein n=1 Tax=Nostoc sp. TaxID=1180 RepID=UPI002FF9CE70